MGYLVLTHLGFKVRLGIRVSPGPFSRCQFSFVKRTAWISQTAVASPPEVIPAGYIQRPGLKPPWATSLYSQGSCFDPTHSAIKLLNEPIDHELIHGFH